MCRGRADEERYMPKAGNLTGPSGFHMWQSLQGVVQTLGLTVGNVYSFNLIKII